MANKLKNMQLTSVDLVRRGANQEADIMLFKSADGEDPGISPQILEHYTPAPADIPIDDSTFLTYTDALAKSIQSIHGDDSLGEAEKAEMIQKSFEQFNEAVERSGAAPAEEPMVEKSAPDYEVIEEIDSKKA